MRVERVHTESGSHIEPPLDESWDELTKLRWLTAVIEADTGVRVRVNPIQVEQRMGSLRMGIVTEFIIYGNGHGWGSSYSSLPYREAWAMLNGVEFGARLALSTGQR